ncbi:CRISPR-associated endonuclease Cas2 [Pectinatus frisingensis]|uniref:CRISPR-associated endonuclease Cas2 n=1 Tax=Pectinatus frisingensis TaxID=865 RepID=UPI0018C6D3DB|nr:CRISPR-associated endonuclease Cas2 [Pectinatus frisingensis]
MYILVSYDINTIDSDGKRRLRKAAKICLNYGQRVQNSVFECKVDEGQYLLLKHQLYEIINETVDNLRFYRLGKNYKKNIESMGFNKAFDIEGSLIL